MLKIAISKPILSAALFILLCAMWGIGKLLLLLAFLFIVKVSASWIYKRYI